ncbi:MAG: metal ABC transporter permease [Thermoanaerobaculia bacterium]|nr:metal ABC transporter permease [Thermoanaerobaculia bacterium]
MIQLEPTVVILLVGSTVAASCALVGTFLVLRKMALLGDAISHAVLPGIVIAFLISGDRSTLPMVLGAAALGVLTVFLVEMGTRTKRLREDASIGVVFPALFAIGVILIAKYAGQIDLDLDCVLYGEIAYTPWDVLFFDGQNLGPKALWINVTILFLDLVFVLLVYKELKITTFDPELSAALGISPVLVHYALMSMLSVTVVGAFESVGAILVVAMLVVPPATAYLLTDQLSRMLLLSVVFGVGSALGGYYFARWLDASIAGAMATVAGLLFATVFLASPRHGLVAKLLRHRRLSLGMSEQLLLLHLDRETESSTLDTVRRRFSWRESYLGRIVRRLQGRGWIAVSDDGGVRLTADGSAAIERTGQDSLRHVVS